jgi:UDP-glucose 4-epimerase
MRAYGLSKCLAEDLCAGFTARTGITSVALRPGWVWDPGMYPRIAEQWRVDPASEWTPTWEYGQFVDVRDVATAAELALTAPLTGHHRLLLAAADIAASGPSLEMAARLVPSVPIRDRDTYRREPFRALFDGSAARRVLGWQPACRWADGGASYDAAGATK